MQKGWMQVALTQERHDWNLKFVVNTSHSFWVERHASTITAEILAGDEVLEARNTVTDAYELVRSRGSADIRMSIHPDSPLQNIPNPTPCLQIILIVDLFSSNCV